MRGVEVDEFRATASIFGAPPVELERQVNIGAPKYESGAHRGGERPIYDAECDGNCEARYSWMRCTSAPSRVSFWSSAS